MNKVQQNRYNSLYQQHLSALKRQGKSNTGMRGTDDLMTYNKNIVEKLISQFC